MSSSKIPNANFTAAFAILTLCDEAYETIDKLFSIYSTHIFRLRGYFQYTLPAESLAPPELLYSISDMLNKTSTSTNKLYIF